QLAQSKTQTVFEIAADISKDLTGELGNKQTTFGEVAFMRYGFKGARGEAESGFKHVQEALEFLDDLSWNSRIKALLYLIANVEDTVFLKRSGSLERMEYHKEALRKINNIDLDTVKRLTSYCIEQNLSFGGSADLLVVSCFLKRYQAEFGHLKID
ncbi:MAG: triphosphoribosyl-dephospho-CoA synthase, partial [Candidatus Izemoplasmatales bacterium]|nr:triphosphoribosyl-dephospho-CoA synthase [Candidatus Izemoplasmatales bacterium]